jgi:heat shock protein HslJ
MKTLFLSLIVLVVLTSCKSKKGATQTIKLENSSWEVIYLSDKLVKAKQTLILNSDQINGQAACNKYSGSIIIGEKSNVKINNILSTKMGCDKLSEEQIFFTNLRNVASYEISKNEELLLYSIDKNLLVKLKKIE